MVMISFLHSHSLVMFFYCVSLLLVGCSTSSRTLTAFDLVVKTPSISWAEKQIVRQRGVYLYRLIPENEVDPKRHRAAFLQRKNELLGIAVEQFPIASGSYANGEIRFVLPEKFEPSTHCFAVVAASGYLIATSAFGSDNKRYLIGLSPYSKRYLGSPGDASVSRGGNMFSTTTDLECAGTLEDFTSKNSQLYSVGTP